MNSEAGDEAAWVLRAHAASIARLIRMARTGGVFENKRQAPPDVAEADNSGGRSRRDTALVRREPWKALEAACLEGDRSTFHGSLSAQAARRAMSTSCKPGGGPLGLDASKTLANVAINLANPASLPLEEPQGPQGGLDAPLGISALVGGGTQRCALAPVRFHSRVSTAVLPLHRRPVTDRGSLRRERRSAALAQIPSHPRPSRPVSLDPGHLPPVLLSQLAV